MFAIPTLLILALQ